MGEAGAAGGNDAVGDGVLQEAPQGGGGHGEASDFVGGPDAEGATAAWSGIAVAAQDAACAEGFAARVGVVKTGEKAVANESADNLAVWTGDQLEALDKGLPFFDAAIKPALLDHVAPSAKNVIVAEGGRSGVAGYDKNPRSGVRGKDAEELCQIVGVTNIRRSDDKSATLRLKCDQSEVRDIYGA